MPVEIPHRDGSPYVKQYLMSATVAASADQVISARVLEAGSGDDVVVCLHGAGSRADRFRPVLAPLAAAGYHVYAFDLPGHGLATKGDLPLSVPYYAEFVAALVKQLAADRVTVLGTSLGGHVGGQMVTLGATRVDRLVMVGTIGIVPMSQEDRINTSRVFLRNRSVDDCFRKLEALMWNDELVTRDWVHEESLINNSSGAEESFARLGHYFEHGINDDLVRDALRDRQDLELGLMWGDRDVIVTVETGRECMEALPGIPMVWIREAGHAPYYERPEDFVTGMELLFSADRAATLEYSI